MGNPPFEDVSPIKDGGFHCYVSLPEGSHQFQPVKGHPRIFGLQNAIDSGHSRTFFVNFPR